MKKLVFETISIEILLFCNKDDDLVKIAIKDSMNVKIGSNTIA